MKNEKDSIAKLKRKWIKKNFFKVFLTAIVVLVIYFIAMAFKNIFIVIINIVLSFIAFFYFRNKMAAYIEKNLYE